MSVALIDEYLPVGRAATEIGITEGRLRQMLRSGEARGEKMGWVWLVPRSEVERIKKNPSKKGRPRTGSRK